MIHMNVSFDSNRWFQDTEALLTGSYTGQRPRTAIPRPRTATATLVSLEDKGLVAGPEPMNRETVLRVLDDITRLFNACPFAVHGLAAMVYYGFDQRQPDRISICVPLEASDGIKLWAKANNVPGSDMNPSTFSFGIRTAQDGKIRLVRVVYIIDFNQLDTISLEEQPFVADAPPRARVLTLPQLADLAACASIQSPWDMPGQRAAHSSDVYWIMRTSVELAAKDARQRMGLDKVKFVDDTRFWRYFSTRYPDAKDLRQRAAQAGIVVPQTEKTKKPLRRALLRKRT